MKSQLKYQDLVEQYGQEAADHQVDKGLETYTRMFYERGQPKKETSTIKIGDKERVVETVFRINLFRPSPLPQK